MKCRGHSVSTANIRQQVRHEPDGGAGHRIRKAPLVGKIVELDHPFFIEAEEAVPIIRANGGAIEQDSCRVHRELFQQGSHGRVERQLQPRVIRRRSARPIHCRLLVRLAQPTDLFYHFHPLVPQGSIRVDKVADGQGVKRVPAEAAIVGLDLRQHGAHGRITVVPPAPKIPICQGMAAGEAEEPVQQWLGDSANHQIYRGQGAGTARQGDRERVVHGRG